MSNISLPNFANMVVVDSKGKFTPQAITMFDQLFSQLGTNFSQNGLVIPQSNEKTTEKLSKTGNGATLIDTSDNNLKVNINGTIKTIQTM